MKLYENMTLRAEQLLEEALLLKKVVENNDLTDDQYGDIVFRLEEIMAEVARMRRLAAILGIIGL